MSLGAKIKSATCESEVIAHLDTGMKRYVHASPKTKRQWSRRAAARITELSHGKTKEN